MEQPETVAALASEYGFSIERWTFEDGTVGYVAAPLGWTVLVAAYAAMFPKGYRIRWPRVFAKDMPSLRFELRLARQQRVFAI